MEELDFYKSVSGKDLLISRGIIGLALGTHHKNKTVKLNVNSQI